MSQPQSQCHRCGLPSTKCSTATALPSPSAKVTFDITWTTCRSFYTAMYKRLQFLPLQFFFLTLCIHELLLEIFLKCVMPLVMFAETYGLAPTSTNTHTNTYTNTHSNTHTNTYTNTYRPYSCPPGSSGPGGRLGTGCGGSCRWGNDLSARPVPCTCTHDSCECCAWRSLNSLSHNTLI